MEGDRLPTDNMGDQRASRYLIALQIMDNTSRCLRCGVNPGVRVWILKNILKNILERGGRFLMVQIQLTTREGSPGPCCQVPRKIAVDV